jgi:hypothetical protein
VKEIVATVAAKMRAAIGARATAAAAGLKRLAVVVADTGLGKMTVEEIVNLNDNERGVLSRTFTSITEAMKWLAEEQIEGDPQ